MISAIVLKKINDLFEAEYKTNVNVDFLNVEDTLIEVEYSSLNYKDALAITAPNKIVKLFPFIPGIDLAGKVIESNNKNFSKGDRVVSTGYGLGEKYFGGFSSRAYVNSAYICKLPTNLSTKEAMSIGTAGLTALLCIQSLLKENIKPNDGPIAITGASGGVGSSSISILSNLGYDVVAITSRKEPNQNYLKQLGASKVYSLNEISNNQKPLNKQLWSAVIDCVGGEILSNLLTEIKYAGCAIICGLAQSYKLNTTVMPFILRGIKLIGIDSVYQNLQSKQNCWDNAKKLFKENYFHDNMKVIPLSEVLSYSEDLINKKVTGRLVISL